MLPRLLYLLPLIWPLIGCQWAAQQFFLPREGIRPSEYSVTVQRHAVMKTSDNIELAADIFRPNDLGKTPTILVRIPFSKTLANQIQAEAVARFWASRGYTAVIQGTRGRYESGGHYYPLINERQDGIETLRWIAQQPWYNGKLGMWGGSVFGYTQWAVADQTDPGPSALDIQICSTDFYGMFYSGGAFALESALYWAIKSHGTEDIDPSLDDLERGFNGFPLIEADNRAIGDVPFFNDWATHQERDEYWQSIDGVDRAKHIKAPALLMAGWFDPFLPTQLNDFVQIRNEADPYVAANTQLIIGPWSHADTVTLPGGINAGDYRQASLTPSIDWFDRHLMGRNIQAAPVKIFVMGDNVWRDEQEWPLTRVKPTQYYLSSSGNANSLRGTGLLTAHAPDFESADHYSYDPLHPVPSRGGAMLSPRAGIAVQNEIEAREDVLVYTSAALEKDTEVTGNIEAVLYVNTSAPNTDFYAKLVDVHADGVAYNVSDGILRQDYPSSSSHLQSPRQITIRLWPTSMVFKKGHHIRLEITSSNYPRYDRNPNTSRNIAVETSTNVAIQSVYHGSTTPSRLILPIVPR